VADESGDVLQRLVALRTNSVVTTVRRPHASPGLRRCQQSVPPP
jgi:hypothetical protein